MSFVDVSTATEGAENERERGETDSSLLEVFHSGGEQGRPVALKVSFKSQGIGVLVRDGQKCKFISEKSIVLGECSQKPASMSCVLAENIFSIDQFSKRSTEMRDETSVVKEQKKKLNVFFQVPLQSAIGPASFPALFLRSFAVSNMWLLAVRHHEF